MNENSLQKCRTCLKSSTKIIPLTKHATGNNPSRTYGQLLKEFAALDCIADYEHLMPQYLCISCCRRLKNSYAFIKQAQHCNNKLINDISRQLDCLQEKTIDLPENANYLEKHLQIKLEKNYVDCQKEENIKTEEPDFNDINLQLEVEIDRTLECNVDSVKREIINNNQSDIIDLPLTSDKKVDNLKINSKKSQKTEMDTTCPICGKKMSRRDNLIKHMRTQHEIGKIGKLPQKQKSESNEDNQNKNKVFKCRSCDYTARNHSALYYHNRSKHGTDKDKFKCKFCTYGCCTNFNLFTHMKNSHKELIKTLKAEAKTEEQNLNNASTLATSKLPLIQNDIIRNENEDSSSNDIPLIERINECHTTSDFNNKMYGDKEQFSDEEFIRNILNIKKRPTKSSTKSLARRCEECGNIYKNYRALYVHQRHVHMSEDKYCLCPHCGKKYKRKFDLRSHINKVHNKNSTEMVKQTYKVREKRFMCTECSYVCTTKTILNVHIKRHHTGEKPYKCDICFKSFIVPFRLKIHRYLHTGERPYKCPICPKEFRDNSYMLKHKRIHSSERAYKCKECSKSFTQAYNLSVHKRTHLKEKNLNCTICEKVFVNMSLLNIHRISENHHDEVV